MILVLCVRRGEDEYRLWGGQWKHNSLLHCPLVHTPHSRTERVWNRVSTLIIARRSCAYWIHSTSHRAPCVLHTCFSVCICEAVLAHTHTQDKYSTHPAFVSTCRGSQRRIWRARTSGLCFEGFRWHSASPSPALFLLSGRACEREHSRHTEAPFLLSFSRTRPYGAPRNVMADPGEFPSPPCHASTHHCLPTRVHPTATLPPLSTVLVCLFFHSIRCASESV